LNFDLTLKKEKTSIIKIEIIATINVIETTIIITTIARSLNLKRIKTKISLTKIRILTTKSKKLLKL